MRWFKKIVRAILALLPLFAIFLIPSNVSALKHDYDGLLLDEAVLIPQAELENGHYVLKDNPSHYIIGPQSYLSLLFDDSVYEIQHVDPYFQNFYLETGNIFYYDAPGGFSTTSTNTCRYGNNENNFELNPAVSLEEIYPGGEHNLKLSTGSMFHGDIIPTGSYSCLNYGYQFSHHVELYSSSNLGYGDLTNQQAVTIFNSGLSPYSSSFDGLKLHDTSVSDSDGNTYSHSFSFARLYNGDMPNKFYYMRIPLSTTDNYFLDSENLYQGRELSFKLLFNFDGSFTWNPDLSNGYSRIRAVGYSPTNENNLSDFNVVNIDCTNNVRTIVGATHLEVTCDYTLDKDYLAFIPAFEIYNPGYVWDSDSWWEFYSFYLITDNDETDGANFNSDIRGTMWSATNGVGGDGRCGDLDLGCKLTSLFRFSSPDTPLGGILGNFSDQTSCASIPTIASMIHSNETQVCPWFSTTVRSISTPVLSLFSVCLIFGFFVRWLKSSSGNDMLNSGKEK